MEKCLFLPEPVYLKLARNIPETFSISKLVVLVISNKFYPHFLKVVQIFSNCYCRHDRQVLRLRFAKKKTPTTTLSDTNGWYVKGKR